MITDWQEFAELRGLRIEHDMYVRCNGQCFKEIISLRDLAMLPDTSSRPCDKHCSRMERKRRESVWISLPSSEEDRQETGHHSVNETWALLRCLNLLDGVSPFFVLESQYNTEYLSGLKI